MALRLNRIRISLTSILVLIMSLTAACYEMSYDELGGEVSDPIELRTGDLIRVVTSDYEDFRFVLRNVTENSLVGSNVKIEFSEVRSIEVITPDYDAAQVAAAAVSVSVFAAITATGLILLQSADMPTLRVH